MEYKTKECYDLTALLKQGDLNIRAVAAAAQNKTAGFYFDMLSELIGQAPVYSEDLRKLINRDGDRNSFKNLADMISLLKSLGYEEHTIDFSGMLDSYDRGFTRLTSTYAGKIIDDFYALCDQIEAARITQPQEAFDDDPYEISLGDWLERQYVENPIKDEAKDKPVILAVDDSFMTLKSVSSYLCDDYKVYMLGKSYLLEKMLNKIKPDMFLLDYNMPVLNGFELVPIIKSYAEHKTTPIIFLTSEGTIDNVSSAVKLGACDFISKPVQPGALRERVARQIRNTGEIRENVS